MSPVPLATNRLRVSRCWLFALTLAAATPPSSAQVQAPAPAGADAPPQGANSAAAASALHADDAIRYRVDIVAPGDVASSLRSAVDLIRWQDYEDMTEDTSEFAALLQVLVRLELLPARMTESMTARDLEQQMFLFLFKQVPPSPLRTTLTELRRLASTVRDRLSVTRHESSTSSTRTFAFDMAGFSLTMSWSISIG